MKMTLGLLATKVGMTQIFTEAGVRLPVTVLQVNDNIVVGKRTSEKNGYTALQIGYGERREKLINKPEAGFFKKQGVSPVRTIREFRVEGETFEKYNVGDKVGLEVMADVANVDVSGTSKGKGFAGVMKRHNFKGFRATHGTHEYFRHGGSIGCRAVPGRVFKGKKMPGQMGNKRVTVINQNVVGTDEERGLIFVRGQIPGGKGCTVEVQASLHRARKIPGLEAAAQTASKNPMKASKAKG
jgi:large subunit ribosomal protein L3